MLRKIDDGFLLSRTSESFGRRNLIWALNADMSRLKTVVANSLATWSLLIIGSTTVAVKTGRMFSYFAYTRCGLLHFLVYSNVVYTIRKCKLWVALWLYKYYSRANVSVITSPQSPTAHATSFDGVYTVGGKMVPMFSSCNFNAL
jgi:hypothetical protein